MSSQENQYSRSSRRNLSRLLHSLKVTLTLTLTHTHTHIYPSDLAGQVLGSVLTGKEGGEKVFNVFSVATINTFSLETLGWLLVLLLNWAMSMPSKKRKGPIAKVVCFLSSLFCFVFFSFLSLDIDILCIPISSNKFAPKSRSWWMPSLSFMGRSILS